MDTFRMALHAAGCLTVGLVGFAPPASPADLTIPNTFVAGTPASAASVNANFSATATAVNTKQDRVAGTCAAGQVIASINVNGSVVCEPFNAGNNQLNAAEAIANSVVIFDTSESSNNLSGTFAAGNAVSAQFTVAANTTVTRISVLNVMGARGNLRFVIFDHPAHNRVLLTDPQPVAADTAGVPTWKDSAPFIFTLLAGTTYEIGAIADVSTNVSFDATLDTVGNFTGTAFASFADFSNPFVQSDFTTFDITTRLWGLLP